VVSAVAGAPPKRRTLQRRTQSVTQARFAHPQPCCPLCPRRARTHAPVPQPNCGTRRWCTARGRRAGAGRRGW
jgi:hypothetical protein